MADARVLGLDIGGTHSRAVLATLAGDVVATGRAAGGNPAAQGLRDATEHITAALHAALGGTSPGAVAACVVGLAGVSTLISDASAARAFDRLWRDLGLTCSVRVVSDVTVAFAAGTPEPHGALALSGTGAVAARMRDRMPARFRDGYGWLLGDDGSGFWIGRQAVRATLSAVDGRAEMTELARAVLAHYLEAERLGGAAAGAGGGADFGQATAAGNGTAARPGTSERDLTAGTATGPAAARRPTPAPTKPARLFAGEAFTRQDRRQAAALVRAVAARPTAALAALAPLVMTACDAGDPAARTIVSCAAAHLVAGLAGVDPVPGEPVVLAGSVLTSRSPVFRAVAAAVADRWPAAPVSVAAEGAAGAAWLAAAGLIGPRQAAARHAAFTAGAGLPADVSSEISSEIS